MKKNILLIFLFLFTGCDEKETWGLYKYHDERLVHFEHFIDNRGKCIEYAEFLNNAYNNVNNILKCFPEE